MTLSETPPTLADIDDAWPYRFQRISDDTRIGRYCEVYLEQLQSLSTRSQELYDERFIETATGQQLRRFGARVGVTRNDGESDEDFRFRVLLNHAVAASDGTAEDIETILRLAFGEAALESITVSQSPSLPVTRFVIDQSLLDTIPVDEEGLTALLDRAFPCGTSVQILTEKVFTFSSDGDTPPAYAAGFGQGVWSSG